MPAFNDKERNMLFFLKNRPGCCIRSNTLYDLEAFFNGYNLCLSNNDMKRKLIPNDFYDFSAEYFGEKVSSAGWYHLITEHSADKNDAIRIFWELLDKYLISIGDEPIPLTEKPEPFDRPDGISRLYFCDLSNAAKSYVRTFNTEPWNDNWSYDTAYDRLLDLYRSPESCCLAAFESNNIAGALMGSIEKYYDGNYLRVVELWTDPVYRGKGYGSLLIEKLTERMKSCNIRKIYLDTMRNSHAADFYKKHGFELWDSICTMGMTIDTTDKKD